MPYSPNVLILMEYLAVSAIYDAESTAVQQDEVSGCANLLPPYENILSQSLEIDVAVL